MYNGIYGFSYREGFTRNHGFIDLRLTFDDDAIYWYSVTGFNTKMMTSYDFFYVERRRGCLDCKHPFKTIELDILDYNRAELTVKAKKS